MNPNIIQLGNFSITWYSTLILIGVIITTIFITREAARFDISKDFMINLTFWTVLMGIIGSRLYYVAFSWSYYSNHIIEIFKVWEGGLAIHGAVIFGAITIISYCKKYKVNAYRMLDIVFPFVMLSQALGRWGNFFNQEAYGPITTFEHLQKLHIPEFIINGMHINGNYYTPTFLYESLWCLLGFILLMIIRRLKYIKIGQVTGTYFIWYSVFRFIIEGYRQDSLMFYGFRIAQLVSVVLFILGIIIVSVQSRKPRLEELYNDQENVEVLRF